MSIEQNGKPRWILIAGNSSRIKKNMPSQWRFRYKDEAVERIISSWEVHGVINEQNHMQGTNPEADGEKELLAWVSYFGTIETTAEGHAIITLHQPSDT